MTDRPVFVFEAQYGTREDAAADYDVLRGLHDAGVIGTYDAAIVTRNDKGKVHVEKHETSTRRGAWTGVVVGAIAGILFPPSVLASAAIGGASGALIGHLARGMSRADMKELGDLLDNGEAAIVVVGESRVAATLEKYLERAVKTTERQIEADAAELNRDLDRALADTTA